MWKHNYNVHLLTEVLELSRRGLASKKAIITNEESKKRFSNFNTTSNKKKV